MFKRTDLQKKLCVEIKGLEDVGYAMYESGFDEVIA